MKRIKLFLAMMFLLQSLDADAATYYVSQTRGKDSNNGISPSTAWKNCPGMANYSGSANLKPGDEVFFYSGDVWPVTGTQGIYLVGGVSYIGDSWGGGDGVRAEIRASADLDAGVVRFRDHPSYPTLFKGFNVNANGKVATGIDINHRYWSLMNGATKRVENCEVHDIWSRTSSGQYKYGIIVSNHGGVGGYAENVEIVNCSVHDVSRDALCLYPGDGNRDCRIKNIIVRGCRVYNTGQDPDYGAGAGLIVKGYVEDAFLEYNYVGETQGAGIFVNGNESNHFGVGPTNVHLRYNIVSTPTVHGGIRIYGGGGDPKDVKIYGNIIVNNTSTGGLSLEGNSGVLDLAVYNNTFYYSFVRFTNHSSTINTLEFKNNVVHCTSGTPLIAKAGNIKNHSNNIFFRGGSSLVTIGSTSYTASNLSSWESSALSVNPMFKNTTNVPSGFTGAYGADLRPNTDGLSLAVGSPALDSGVSLISPYNDSANSVKRPSGEGWDRGAYEMSVSLSTPSAPRNLKIAE